MVMQHKKMRVTMTINCYLKLQDELKMRVARKAIYYTLIHAFPLTYCLLVLQSLVEL
jgi:hypothetical protein